MKTQNMRSEGMFSGGAVRVHAVLPAWKEGRKEGLGINAVIPENCLLFITAAKKEVN